MRYGSIGLSNLLKLETYAMYISFGEWTANACFKVLFWCTSKHPMGWIDRNYTRSSHLLRRSGRKHWKPTKLMVNLINCLIAHGHIQFFLFRIARCHRYNISRYGLFHCRYHSDLCCALLTQPQNNEFIWIFLKSR